jgi:hypothetical protein
MGAAALAAAAVAILAQGAAGAIADHVREHAREGIRRVSTLVRGKFAGDPDAEGVLVEVETQSALPANVEALARLIEKRASEDLVFAQELELAVREVESHVSIGEVVTNVFGSAQVGKMATFRDVHGDVRL